MRTVDSTQLSKLIASTDMQENQRPRHRILFIIGIGGFHEEFVPNVFIRTMAGEAGCLCRRYPFFLHDRRGIAVKRHLNELFGSIDLRIYEALYSFSDMASSAGDTLMRRNLIGSPFRSHDMA